MSLVLGLISAEEAKDLAYVYNINPFQKENKDTNICLIERKLVFFAVKKDD